MRSLLVGEKNGKKTGFLWSTAQWDVREISKNLDNLIFINFHKKFHINNYISQIKKEQPCKKFSSIECCYKWMYS